jgi:hypothetical protein
LKGTFGILRTLLSGALKSLVIGRSASVRKIEFSPVLYLSFSKLVNVLGLRAGFLNLKIPFERWLIEELLCFRFRATALLE